VRKGRNAVRSASEKCALSGASNPESGSPMPEASPVLSARGQVAALSRSRADDDPEYVAARQNLTALQLERHVRKVLANAPRPSDERLQRIAAILLSGGAV
jgi:hypothetical protein